MTKHTHTYTHVGREERWREESVGRRRGIAIVPVAVTTSDPLPISSTSCREPDFFANLRLFFEIERNFD